MKFHIFKPYAKYGLFLIFLISLVGTAYADTNQLVYYNWSADTGNTIVDNSGHGNNGTNNGSTTFILPTGQIARHFNGQSRITIPNNAQLAFTDPHITFGVFFRYDYSNPNHTYLVSKGNNAFRISIDHTNMTYEVYADGHAIYGYSETQIQPNKDYEAIVTYNGSHAQLYINGVANGKGIDYTAAALDPSYNRYNWTIGSFPDTTYGLKGTIYAFYVYNRTLNSSEILNLYSSDIHSIKNLKKSGGIALSWDDTGHIDSCYQYLSMFQHYNATCTMNVNKVNNSRSMRPQTLITELNALHSAGWEIASHGYDHVNSVQFLDTNTPTAWLNQEIFPNIVEITLYGYPVYTLAYPFSSRNATTDATLAPYFRTLRTRVPTVVNGNVNETTLAYYDWDDAQLLYGVEIDDQSGGSLQSIENGIDYAIKTGTVLVLYGHLITPDVTGQYQTSTSRLDSILNYTSRDGGVFYHMGDLGNSSWVQLPKFSNVASNYTVSTNSLLAGKNVTFVDYSINQTTELLDFGDGSPTSNTANVTHTYTTPGVYTANLTVTNDVSSDSMLQTITVIPSIPVARFTTNSTIGFRSLNIAFTDTSTGFPTSWSWDLGDGSTSTSQNPEHEYSNVGNYSVALTVANEIGSNYTQKINYITVLPQPPSSNFISNITSGNIPLTVKFYDTSTGSPSSWNWDFGDRYTSTEQNPTHTYSSAGNYIVNLTVSNENGIASKTREIIVQKAQNEMKIFPVADFSANVTSGYAPLSVLFIDLSKSATSKSWDIDNDGIVDSTNMSLVHSYNAPGTYTVSLIVSNKNGTASKTATINVLQVISSGNENSGSISSGGSSSGGIGSGGGGGAGGSPEPQSNVETKELSQAFITSGKAVKFDFPRNATSVVYVSFNSKKTAGKTTTIAEMLKGKSTLVRGLPSDEIYKSFNIWVGNSGFATPKNIENAVLCFKVEKSWIQDKNIDRSSITLNRYNDTKWNSLPTSLLGEDDRYMYFTAKTPGFSTFTITGKTTASETKKQPVSVNETQTKPNNGNTAANVEQKPEQKQSTNTSGKGNTGIPGFDMICGIVSLLAVFQHKRK
jgi:PGF-pre-PGF domain-containing protein